jgi:hypothetical protein
MKKFECMGNRHRGMFQAIQRVWRQMLRNKIILWLQWIGRRLL